MPWCPKCKTEYREGVEKCADCGTPLVDDLNIPDDSESEVTLCYIKNGPVAEKLVSYLDYSGIKSSCVFDPDEEVFEILVRQKDLKKAKTEYKGFLMVEASMFTQRISQTAEASEEDNAEDPDSETETETEEETDVSGHDIRNTIASLSDAPLSDSDKEALLEMAESYKPAGVYQSQADKALDLSSTGKTFILAGLLVFVFVLLNIFKVINLFSFEENLLTLIILMLLAAASIGVGIGALMRSKKVSGGIDAEKKLTDEINEWLEDNISIMTEGDLSGEDDTPEEILYLKRTAAMKRALYAKFGSLDEDFADSLIEELYNKHF